MNEGKHRSRRDFLRLAAGVSTALAVGAPAPGMAQAPRSPTPSCPDDARATPRQTEGPFFKPDSPRRTSLLEPGMGGVKIVLSGLVLSTGCRPVARALVDVWHADDRGAYDNSGTRLRGHLFTDDQGRYRLETIVPGAYVGRTRHYHVKVQAPNRPVLTTQLYFPNDLGNERDPIFDRALVMQVRDAADGKAATFDFVLSL
jgi:protocatechuate 3,4-dioxygenase beta subunit